MSAFGGDPGRPYSGQAHTFTGDRGKATLPDHMTLRDLGDLVVETVRHYRSLMDRFGGAMDAEAVTQNLLVEVEKEALPLPARVFLWQLLDDIDTLDDSCRGDDAAFREKVRNVQRRRFEVATSDGYRLTWRDRATRKELER